MMDTRKEPNMKGLPLLLGSMSGSVGGNTFSHNAGGPYVRLRGNPTQPNTPAQAALKGFFGSLATAWRVTLTAAQRDDWDLYAAATPLIDRIGQQFFPTGLNMFIRGNTGLLQNGNPQILAGPAVPGLPTFTPPTVVTISASTNQASIAFEGTDAWVDVDETHLIIYASRGQGASINFFKGPYQLAGSVDGDGVLAPTSPADITVPFNLTDGQKVFFRATLIDETGRKGTDVFFEGPVTSG